MAQAVRDGNYASGWVTRVKEQRSRLRYVGKRDCYFFERTQNVRVNICRGVLTVSDTRYHVCITLVVLPGVMVGFAVLAKLIHKWCFCYCCGWLRCVNETKSTTVLGITYSRGTSTGDGGRRPLKIANVALPDTK